MGLLLGSVIAGLAGCGAPMEWARPGANDLDVATAMEDCRALAREQEWRESWYDRSPSSLDGRFRLRRDRDFDRYWPRYQSSLGRELELQNFCMQSKGYRLQTVQQAEE